MILQATRVIKAPDSTEAEPFICSRSPYIASMAIQSGVSPPDFLVRIFKDMLRGDR